MILFEDRKLLIFTPPHTASGNLHRACCKQAGAIWVNGPVPDSGLVWDHHTTKIHNSWEDYQLAVVVRCPFARAVGLWFHLVEWNRSHGYGCCDFSKFVEWLKDDNPEYLTWMYRFTICRWLKQFLEKELYVVRYESLVDDLERLLGQKLIMPSGRNALRKELAHYYQPPGTLEAVTAWATEDLLRWKYSVPFVGNP